MLSKATTVDAYLKELPADRRESLAAVRDVIRRNLDQEFEEGMLYGMIGYYVPHSVYPPGYHCDPSKPLCYMGLGAFKNKSSLYLMCVYGNPKIEAEFRIAWAKTGKKLDMGKACIRFKTADDLPLQLIGEMAGKFTAREWAAHCEATISQHKASKQQAAKKAVKKKAVKTKSPAKKKASRR